MRLIAVILSCVGWVLSCSAAQLILQKEQCTPAENESYASLSTVTFAFDMSEVYAANPNVSPDKIGICASMVDAAHVIIYKGSVENGEIFAEINQGVYPGMPEFIEGATSISFKLDKEYILEPSQLYTMYIPDFVFIADTMEGLADFVVLGNTSYSFYGAEATGSQLLCEGYFPESETKLEVLPQIMLKFNQSVTISADAKASLFDGVEEISTITPTVSDTDDQVVLIDFNNPTLFVSHNYIVKVQENSIFSKDTNTGYNEIDLIYDGASYKHYSYGRIAPSNNSVVSYLSEITVPLRYDGDYTIGRSKAPKAYLYEGESEEPLETINCESGIDAKSWIIPVWKFDLNPSSSYKVVIPADQCTPWYTDESGILREVKDTSNPELVLNYTTPAELVMPTPVTVATSTPANDAELSTLGDVKIDFSAFSFNDISYNIVLTESDNNKIYLYEGESSEPIAEIVVKFITDGENNVGIESVATSDCILYNGHNYRLVVPAGMFTCSLSNLAPYVKNEEYTINLKGATRTEFDITYQIIDGGSMTTTVAKGSTPTFKVVAPQDWKVEYVKFNGEEVELVNDEYTTPAIEADATVEVEYAYAEEIQFLDLVSSIEDIDVDGSNYSVGKDGEYVVVNNVAKGDVITVYTVGGMQVANHIANNDIVKIQLPAGIYIIRVNNVTFKIQH